jgi:hypothetical protein
MELGAKLGWDGELEVFHFEEKRSEVRLSNVDD